MTYPSQPGYPTPQYGQPRPPGQQQNNLWLVGGAILVILVIIMTVILLVVQKTTESNSGDGGSGDGTTAGDGGDDGGGDDGGDDGGDTDYEGLGGVEINADACSAFDMTAFEAALGPNDPDQTYTSASNSGGLASLSCTFYNEDFDSVTMRLYDYESLDDVLYYIESDADYYNEENGYEFSEYTALGDAGSLYSTGDDTYRTVNLHVALGSIELTVYASWYDGAIDDEAALTVLEDYVRQCDQLFAEYK
ncbi:hypothetical protein [Glycomyces paridis]|uniref:DUF3558 domain-containing protein n=1 Tax=Glycomyces paridis TaxID=2126555 RepID=A0A4S8P371_9ACTN|nr:hypothetical protein [Glycomyces paridis]THV24448.1 hypothetical protein E9998_20745 [Glycomyces paridis]